MQPREKQALAVKLAAAGQNDQALSLLREALRDEDSSALWNDWAAVQFARGNSDEAESGFRVALQLDPGHAQAALNLGALLSTQRRYWEALAVLRAGRSGELQSAERASLRLLVEQAEHALKQHPSSDESVMQEYLLKFASNDPNARAYFDVHLRRFAATLALVPEGTKSMRLLELGAAFHHLSPALSRWKGYGEVRCSDVWEGEAQQVRRVASSANDESYSFVVDNFDLQRVPWPYEDGSFDVVLCCEILEHLFSDPMGLFAEINRGLKHNGTLLLTTPNLASAHAVEQSMLAASPYVYGKFEISGSPTDRHNREYTAGEVERLALAAGFRLSALRTRDFYWPAKRDVLRALVAQGHSIARRGDATFLLARKTSPLLDRYPEEFYATSGVQADRRDRQSPAPFPTSDSPTHSPARNILLVHEILPHFDCSGADLRLFELVRELRAMGHKVTVLARDGRDADKYRPPLEALGAAVICGDPGRLRHLGEDPKASWDLPEFLERGRFDIAILSHWFWSGISVAEHYMDEIRCCSPRTLVMVLSEDRHGERERRLWQLSGLLSDLERGNDFEQREMEIYERADLVLYVTETDQRHFLSLLPDLKTEYLPTIAEAGTPGGGFPDREGVLFLGNFENLANRDAVRWLLEEVWPLVRKHAPEINLYIAGHGATPDLIAEHPNVTLLGKIGELAPAFAARRVFLGPIRYGTGIITKNMIALAHGLPVVTTSVGAEGLQLHHESHALIADSPEEFAAQVLRLHRDQALWNSLATAGRDYIQSKFSLENLRSQIRRIVSYSGTLQPRPADPGHTWSYRAVEQAQPQVLTQRPPHYRNVLRPLAYWQMGRRFLDSGRPAEALEQFRHIFATTRGPLPSTVFHSTLLNDMARCYRKLRDSAGAGRCEKELRTLVHAWKTPQPPDPRLSGKKQPEKSPEISVVIPAFNRKDTLRLCLSALAFQSLPALRWEVVVVDDGSSDGTDALCRELLLPFSSLRYVRQENRGAGAARRKGVELARGEFVLFFNDDTIAGSHLLLEHLALHRQNPHEKWAILGGFSPSMDSIHRALSLWVNTSPFLFPQHTLKPGALCDEAFFITCNLSVRRDAVLEAGSFDPRFRVAEDSELGARLVQRGYRVKYHPKAGAVHEHGKFTTEDLIRRARTYGTADWKLFQKHPRLLGSGAGPFGRLEESDFLRIQNLLEEKREAVRAGLAALESLEEVDMIPLCQKDDRGKTAAESILAQLAHIVPLVYWHYLFESFLDAWKASPGNSEITAALETAPVEIP